MPTGMWDVSECNAGLTQQYQYFIIFRQGSFEKEHPRTSWWKSNVATRGILMRGRFVLYSRRNEMMFFRHMFKVEIFWDRNPEDVFKS